MADFYDHIDDERKAFIERQHMFFVATAPSDPEDGFPNLSPKGRTLLRVLGPNLVAYLDYPGSGNETAAHLLENNRITLMFCAFEGAPLILRLYGQAQVFHPRDAEWECLASFFPAIPGARQIVDASIDLVQTSCGWGVPLFDFKDERDQLEKWAENKGPEGIRKYWEERNQQSIDGKPTGISAK